MIVPLVYDPILNILVRDPEYSDELVAEVVASSFQGLSSSGQETQDESFNHAIEGIEHFFSNFCQSRGRVQDPLQPSSQHRLRISELSGGAAQSRRNEFWIGMKISIFAVIGIPFDQIQDNQIEELMKYQGNIDAHMQCLGLDQAMHNWSVWPDIEDNIHQNSLSKI
jgi:hypothetical protein